MPPSRRSITRAGRWLVGRRDLLVGRFDAPDLAGVFRDGPVAGELSGGGDVADHSLGPLYRVLKGNGRDDHDSSAQEIFHQPERTTTPKVHFSSKHPITEVTWWRPLKC